MKLADKNIEVKVERTIPATPEELFDGWLDPTIPGNPWNQADKVILDAKVDGLFFWRIMETSHYGRFTELERGTRIQHTWMSPNTLGRETTVTVTFKKKGEDTVMTLLHTGLPDTDEGRSHDGGWNYFLDTYAEKTRGRLGKK